MLRSSFRVLTSSLPVSFVIGFALVLSSCGGSTGSSGNNSTSTPAPTASISSSVSTINAGQSVTLTWQTTNATSVTISPSVGSSTLPTSGTVTVQPTQTTTYTITATGAGGTATQSVAVTVNALVPAVTSFKASASAVSTGSFVTLTWSTVNSASVSITPAVGDGESALPVNTGANGIQVAITQNTTFTLVAVAADGTKSQPATLTVNAVSLSLTVSPTTVPAFSKALLTVTADAPITSVTLDHNIGKITVPEASPTPIFPSATTTYTATATLPSGATITSSVTVTVTSSTNKTPLKHIIFLLQENRSFDNYFGMLGNYRAQRLQGVYGNSVTASAGDVDSFICSDYPTCSTISIKRPDGTAIPLVLTNPNGKKVTPYHLVTSCVENTTPSWDESHYDVDFQGNWSDTASASWTADPNKFLMDRFLVTTASQQPYPGLGDPESTRPLGYYTNQDLPYYYDVATFFATSDRWFSPMPGQTEPNRMYLFAASSFGHIFPDAQNHVLYSPETIFRAMTSAGVSWRYYYQDNSVFLAQFQDWNSNSIKSNVYPISDYYNVLSSPNADQQLPEVIFIERASNSAYDEHPDTGTNNQNGAARVQQIVSALMKSSAWQDSAFILTFDEGGGLYDHVPPFQEPVPDGWAPGNCPDPDTTPSYCQDIPGENTAGAFNLSGFRLPFMVISPWAKPHFVSHVNRDNTAILGYIEELFGVPSLTARDKYYTDPSRDMSEFFDFTQSSPALLNAPDGRAWTDYLPTQQSLDANSPGALPCNATLEGAPASHIQ